MIVNAVGWPLNSKCATAVAARFSGVISAVRRLRRCCEMILPPRESSMSVRIVRLGTARAPGEGPRIGTVRRPPRGVPKEQFAAQNWYDVWFPNLAPSLETMKLGLAASSPAQWSAFARKYRAEMAEPGARHDLQLLAVLSHAADFSVGCYCEHEDRCHRSILKQLLAECGAKLEQASESRR